MQKTLARPPQPEAHQTVRLNLDSKDTTSSIRISFTDQRLTAHGGMIVWSHFLHQKRFRQQLRDVLPHTPTSPNAYDPTDVALGYVGGILCGADKLSRVAWLQSDPAIAQVLGVEAVPDVDLVARCERRRLPGADLLDLEAHRAEVTVDDLAHEHDVRQRRGGAALRYRHERQRHWWLLPLRAATGDTRLRLGGTAFGRYGRGWRRGRVGRLLGVRRMRQRQRR